MTRNLSQALVSMPAGLVLPLPPSAVSTLWWPYWLVRPSFRDRPLLMFLNPPDQTWWNQIRLLPHNKINYYLLVTVWDKMPLHSAFPLLNTHTHIHDQISSELDLTSRRVCLSETRTWLIQLELLGKEMGVSENWVCWYARTHPFISRRVVWSSG